MAKHILIVDDDALMRRSLAFNLEQAGYHTITSDSAKTALSKIHNSIQFNRYVSSLFYQQEYVQQECRNQ